MQYDSIRLVSGGSLRAALAGLSVLASSLMIQGAVAQEGKTLRFAEITEPPALSLHENVGATLFTLQAIYEPLLRVDDQMQLQPGLAVSWKQLDEVTYQLKLREGVRFHSGNPLTAQAVKDYFAWHLGPAGTGNAIAYLKPISEMTVHDKLTLDIRLHKPYGPFLHHLTMPHTGISDIRQFESAGRDAMRIRPSGAGPFMLARWDLGSEVVLKANPDYWEGKPGVDWIRVRYIPDAAARSLALEAGEVDIVESVAGPDIARLEARPDVNVVDQFEFRGIVWVLNTHHPILSDINVRRAFAHAVDYGLVFESLLGPAARTQKGLLPVGTFGFAEGRYAYDPELAARLLAESGWRKNSRGFYEKDGKTLELTHVSGAHVPQEVEVAEAIQTLMREFGIDLKIQVLERAVHTTTMFANAKAQATGQRPDFATTQWDHGIRTGDGSIMLDPLFTCGGARNFGHYCNPAYDALIAKAVSGAPEAERLEAYRQAQAILYENVVALSMWQPRITMSSRSNVKNLNLLPTRVLRFGQITLD